MHEEYEPNDQEWQKVQKELADADVREVYVVFHATWIQGYLGVKENILSKLTRMWTSIEIFSDDFSRLESDSIWRSLSRLILSLQEPNREVLFDELARCIKKELTLVQRLSILKYYVAHLFLPLDIDFQALQQFKDEGRQKEYATKIIEEYKSRKNDQNKGYPFLQLLVDLQFLVTKTDGIKVEDESTVKKSSDTELPDGKCLKDFVEKAQLQDAHLRELWRAWEVLGDDWEMDKEAPIVQFLKELDYAVVNNNPGGFVKTVCTGIDGMEFHKWFEGWFSKFEEVLDQLEEKLQ